jgi:predicted alpha-1,6-mannanase (GH76 family)
MWWAMFILEMHDLSNDSGYLTTAATIWTHVSQYVIPAGKYNVNGQDMVGAVLWTNHSDEHQVNAITAGLFSELSARLALSQDPGSSQWQTYLDAAINSLFWIGRCRFDATKLAVLDHIELDTNQTVDWKFTYNTGQAIAASIAICRALEQDPTASTNASLYLSLAAALARSAMINPTWMDPDGTLTERGAYPGTGASAKPASQNDQCVGFKSILVRSLAKLYLVLSQDNLLPDLQDQLRKFIQWQFDSLQDRDTNGNGQYGPWWAGPMDVPTSHSQLAALDVLAAIHVINR